MARDDQDPKWMKFSIVESIFSISAFVLMWIAALRCNFVKFTDSYTAGSDNEISLQFGIWYFRSWTVVTNTNGSFLFESCNYYPDYVDIDTNWKAARTFSVLVFIFGIIIFLASVVSACTQNPYKPEIHGCMGVAYLLVALFQGLCLLLLASNLCKDNQQVAALGEMPGVSLPETCAIDIGAKLCISAMCLWFGAGCARFLASKSLKEAEKEEAEAGLDAPLVP